MGTSVNTSSPPSPNWKLAKSVLGHTDVTTERQSEELWKAAANDHENSLFDQLQSKHLANASKVAEQHINPIDALREYDNKLQKERTASLAIDMGKRALAKAVVNNSGSKGFATELFSEVVSYYASRDLPSFVGSVGRISSVRQSIDLKNQLRSITKKIALSTGKVRTDTNGWKRYVQKVLIKLQGVKTNE